MYLRSTELISSVDDPSAKQLIETREMVHHIVAQGEGKDH
jgi:hypothetical protein